MDRKAVQLDRLAVADVADPAGHNARLACFRGGTGDRGKHTIKRRTRRELIILYVCPICEILTAVALSGALESSEAKRASVFPSGKKGRL
jgi:hypothetical protein